MISVGSGAAVTVYGSMLKFIGTCDCVQGHKSFQRNELGVACKDVLEYLGSKIIIGASGNLLQFKTYLSSINYIL
jgi:hypothetical protein